MVNYSWTLVQVYPVSGSASVCFWRSNHALAVFELLKTRSIGAFFTMAKLLNDQSVEQEKLRREYL